MKFLIYSRKFIIFIKLMFEDIYIDLSIILILLIWFDIVYFLSIFIFVSYCFILQDVC